MRSLLSIIFTIVYCTISAQDISFEFINSNHGLSQNGVNCILEDSRGYLWFATNEGLNRYDGYEFKVYRISDSKTNTISSNLIVGVVEDHDHNLWIATQDNGVCHFDVLDEKFTFYRNSSDYDDLLHSNISLSIFCDSKNRIWVADYYGVDVYPESDSGKKRQPIKVKNLNDRVSRRARSKIYNITEDSQGRILASMSIGVVEIKFNESKNGQPRLSPLAVFTGLMDVRKIVEVDNGFLIAHYFGISFVNELTPEATRLKNQDMLKIARGQDILIESDSIIWVATTQGVYRLKYSACGENRLKQTHHFNSKNKALPIDDVTDILLDRTGIVWVAMNGGGIGKYNKRLKQFRSYRHTDTEGSLSYNKIKTIYEDKQHNLWIGTHGGGLNYLPTENEKNYTSGFSYYYNNQENERHIVHDLLSVGDSAQQEIWMGTGYSARIAKLKQEDNEWDLTLSHVPIKRGTIFSITKDEYNNIWMGAYRGGLYKAVPSPNGYHIQQFKEANSNISSDVIHTTFEDSRGRLWVGTSKGLVLLTKKEKNAEIPKFKIFKNNQRDSTSLSFDYVLRVMESSDSTIWIGTMGGGLNKYVEGTTASNGSFIRISEKNGLANNTIKEIIEDNNHKLWIASNRGLSKLDPKTNKIRNYTQKHGLQDLEFSECSGTKLHDGEILMGGINGFNAFYPDDITEDSIPPKVVFTKLDVLNKTVDVNDKVNDKVLLKHCIDSDDIIELGYSENNFRLHFSALHYAAPENNKYKYRLKGYDNNWITSSGANNFAKYTSLKAGEYVFEIYACNSDGYWAPIPRRKHFYIRSPFWTTNWFILLLSVIAMFIVYAAYWVKTHSILNRQRRLEALVQERTQDLLKANSVLEQSREEVQAQNDEILSKQQELEYHKENLERIVEERTVDLKKAKEYAEDSDKLKSAFLANMSHEIRTPMNAIIGFGSLMKDVVNYPELLMEYVTKITTSSERLLVLINDILDISRIEANQLRLLKSNFDFNGLIKSCFDTAWVSIKSKSFELILENEVENEKIRLNSDKIRIEQIIANLLSNACKFTHDGNVKLRIKKDTAGSILVSVEDTGIGIARDKLPVIFDRFRKIDEDKRVLYSGVGIGLSISKKLSELLGCRLEVESEEGFGSTFTLYIPTDLLVRAPAMTSQQELVVSKVDLLKGRSVLIVEDEKYNYELLRDILISFGCETKRAKNGLIAVNFFEVGHRFDLVLMDIKMPVMNGIEALHAIREIAPDQPIVAQTAFAYQSDKEKILKEGFDFYVIKPIKKDEFIEFLDHHLAYSRNEDRIVIRREKAS